LRLFKKKAEMLSSIANFLFGSFNSDHSDLSRGCDRDENLKETFIKGFDGEDWILVNHNEKLANNTQNFNQGKSEKNQNNLNVSSNQSIHETQPNNNAMDESWFITPPPSFTKNLQVASSPIEDILIEHPSTSVFHRHFSLFGFLKDSNSTASKVFQCFESKANEKDKKDRARGRNKIRKTLKRETRKEAQKREEDHGSGANSKESKGNENGKDEKVNKKVLEGDSNLKQRHTQKQSNFFKLSNITFILLVKFILFHFEGFRLICQFIFETISMILIFIFFFYLF